MKKSIEDEISDAINFWDIKKMFGLIQNLFPIFHLYNVEEDSDWLSDKLKDSENLKNYDENHARLIMTVYLISKLSESQSGVLDLFREKFPRLHERMEDIIGD